jgi:hypothetical protein
MSLSPWRNPRRRSICPLGDRLLRNPITGIGCCCARAASGYAATEPAITLMTSLRLMRAPDHANSIQSDNYPTRLNQSVTQLKQANDAAQARWAVVAVYGAISLLLALVITALPFTAEGHDIYNDLRGPDGMLCCGGHECSPIINVKVLPSTHFLLEKQVEAHGSRSVRHKHAHRQGRSRTRRPNARARAWTRGKVCANPAGGRAYAT